MFQNNANEKRVELQLKLQYDIFTGAVYFPVAWRYFREWMTTQTADPRIAELSVYSNTWYSHHMHFRAPCANKNGSVNTFMYLSSRTGNVFVKFGLSYSV